MTDLREALGERVSISPFLAGMFGLRWILGREGYDPCDEIDVDALMLLPDGLSYQDGRISFQCNCCERWAPWEGEVDEFEYGDPMNLCGGSPRCCP